MFRSVSKFFRFFFASFRFEAKEAVHPMGKAISGKSFQEKQTRLWMFSLLVQTAKSRMLKKHQTKKM
jgi:hypothetical protein